MNSFISNRHIKWREVFPCLTNLPSTKGVPQGAGPPLALQEEGTPRTCACAHRLRIPGAKVNRIHFGVSPRKQPYVTISLGGIHQVALDGILYVFAGCTSSDRQRKMVEFRVNLLLNSKVDLLFFQNVFASRSSMRLAWAAFQYVVICKLMKLFQCLEHSPFKLEYQSDRLTNFWEHWHSPNSIANGAGAWRRLKSPVTSTVAQQLLRANNQKNIKALHLYHDSLMWVSTLRVEMVVQL